MSRWFVYPQDWESRADLCLALGTSMAPRLPSVCVGMCVGLLAGVWAMQMHIPGSCPRALQAGLSL